MTVEIIPHAPRVRCYVCGRPEVAMVCHHCGRAMCDRHGPTPVPEGRTIENPEFTDLGLSHTATGETGIHCKHCVHYVRSYRWMITLGAVVGVLGLIVLLAGIPAEGSAATTTGVFATLAAIGLVTWGISLQRGRYRQEIIDSRPPLPVIGNIRSVSVAESIRGQITLDAEGRYTSRADQPQGKLTLTLYFTPRDRERLDTYLKKYDLASSDDILFHAGFVVLQGSTDLHFDDPSVCMSGQVNTIALTEYIEDQPFLSSTGAGRGNRWIIRHTYTFPLNHDGTAPILPVQIIPTLIQEGAQRAIELVLQLAPEAGGPSVLTELARIEELTLRAPQSLGKVELVEPAALVGAAAEASEAEEVTYTQAITWKGVSAAPGERRGRRKSFYVRFENAIEPTTVLNGRLRVRFDGALSGLEGVALFYPLGNKRQGVSVQQHTYVDVDFNLDLGGLRFQEMAALEKRIVREEVVPDHHMVTALTSALSADDFYVKRVIENPPRTSKAGAHITNRYWDVAGRFYDGVYPLDFHLVLTGEEVYGGTARPYAGKTQMDVTVQGAVTDEEMRGQVAYLRDRLVEIINGTLDELPRTLTEMLPPMTEERIVVEEEETTAAPVTPMQPLAIDRVAVLHARLDKLDDALLDGRICEARYEEMRARIEQKLAELASEG
jgi:hypothetical protein